MIAHKDIRFNIGDEVISLYSSPENNPAYQPRIRGYKYKVLATLFCIKCGCQNINITTVRPPSYLSDSLHCRFCDGYQSSDCRYFTASAGFISADHIEEKLELAIKEERYEDAQVLHDTQKQMAHAK